MIYFVFFAAGVFTVVNSKVVCGHCEKQARPVNLVTINEIKTRPANHKNSNRYPKETLERLFIYLAYITPLN